MMKIAWFIQNLSGQNWREGIKDQTVRALRKNTLEKETQLKDCEHQIMVTTASQNDERVQFLEALGKSWGLYTKHECDANVKCVRDALLPLASILCERNRVLFVELSVLKAPTLFGTTCMRPL